MFVPRGQEEEWARWLVALAQAEQEEYGQLPVPGTSLDPLAWASTHARVIDPVKGRLPFRPFPYQETLLRDRSPRRLILKARQTGLSSAISIEALHAAIVKPDTTVLFASKNKDAAQELIRVCNVTLSNLTKAPKVLVESREELAFANGSRLISLPATPSTGRSIAASKVYLDEFAFCKYDSEIYQSVVGTLSTGGDLTILSTPKGTNNMFYRLWAGLEGGEWSRHLVHWSACPRYTPEWAARMKADMTEQGWAEEYECDFIASGAAVFKAEQLANCRKGWVPYDPTQKKQPYSRYVTSWDIGRRRDHTVGITIGKIGDAWHEVMLERFLAPYPVIQQRIESRAKMFPGLHLVESNGPGDPVIENLNCKVEGFQTTAKSKVQAIQALQMMVEQGKYLYGSVELDRELMAYEWDDEALTQDCVMAAAIGALKARTGALPFGWMPT